MGKQISIHDEDCKGYGCITGAIFDDFVCVKTYIKWYCWDCYKDLGTLVTWRRRKK